MSEHNCVVGCKVFTGGEIEHDEHCPFYPESLTKINKDRIEELETELTIEVSTRQHLKAKLARVEDMLCSIMDKALSVGGYPESTPNAVGQPVSTDPSPYDVVCHALNRMEELEEYRADWLAQRIHLQAENERLKERLALVLNTKIDWHDGPLTVGDLGAVQKTLEETK